MMPAASDNGFKPVTFTFKNIGPVKNAEMELGDLTIIAGRNNTGKTYLVYTLYGFLAMWDTWPGAAAEGREPAADGTLERSSTVKRIVEQIMERGRAVVEATPDFLASERRTVMQALTRSFSREALSGVFSSPPEAFKGASILIDLHRGHPKDRQSVKVDIRQGGTISMEYSGNNLVVTADLPGTKDVHDLLLHYVTRFYLRFLFPELPSNPFVLSAERFGISLFYRELDFTKNQLVDLLQKMGDRKIADSYFPFFVLDQWVSRYALPVKRNITYTRNVLDIIKQRSELYAEGLFKDIKKSMGGYYTASNDGIEFHSTARGERRFVIPLHRASSSARGLSDLYFFLRHKARKGHLLIIDEPESHLDTANQVLLARLLARMVRAGLKVLVTTHSDYLVKEINNLIMLNSTFARKAQVIRKFNYGKKDFIDPERIRAYVARDQGLHKCAIDKFGIGMPNFDETIDEINHVANELSLRLDAESKD